jgi:hypothetical protein
MGKTHLPDSSDDYDHLSCHGMAKVLSSIGDGEAPGVLLELRTYEVLTDNTPSDLWNATSITVLSFRGESNILGDINIRAEMSSFVKVINPNDIRGQQVHCRPVALHGKPKAEIPPTPSSPQQSQPDQVTL